MRVRRSLRGVGPVCRPKQENTIFLPGRRGRRELLFADLFFEVQDHVFQFAQFRRAFGHLLAQVTFVLPYLQHFFHGLGIGRIQAVQRFQQHRPLFGLHRQLLKHQVLPPVQHHDAERTRLQAGPVGHVARQHIRPFGYRQHRIATGRKHPVGAVARQVGKTVARQAGNKLGVVEARPVARLGLYGHILHILLVFLVYRNGQHADVAARHVHIIPRLQLAQLQLAQLLQLYLQQAVNTDLEKRRQAQQVLHRRVYRMPVLVRIQLRAADVQGFRHRLLAHFAALPQEFHVFCPKYFLHLSIGFVIIGILHLVFIVTKIHFF